MRQQSLIRPPKSDGGEYVASETKWAVKGARRARTLGRVSIDNGTKRLVLSGASDLASQLSVYADEAAVMDIVAPTGWNCTASFGADGSSQKSVLPTGEVLPQSNALPVGSSLEASSSVASISGGGCPFASSALTSIIPCCTAAGPCYWFATEMPRRGATRTWPLESAPHSTWADGLTGIPWTRRLRLLISRCRDRDPGGPRRSSYSLRPEVEQNRSAGRWAGSILKL
jgi:hypothetical protein